MSATDTLPKLLDCKAIRTELGITEAAALAFMRKLPKVEIEGLRKTYVRRQDLVELLNRSTKS